MDKINLYKCAQSLSARWKSFFGLGTEYVGYFEWEMAWSLMGYYRYALPGELDGLPSADDILRTIGRRIDALNTELNEAHKLPEIWLTKEQAAVLPDLIDVLNHYERDIIEATNEEWNEWIDFLRMKCKKEPPHLEGGQ